MYNTVLTGGYCWPAFEVLFNGTGHRYIHAWSGHNLGNLDGPAARLVSVDNPYCSSIYWRDYELLERYMYWLKEEEKYHKWKECPIHSSNFDFKYTDIHGSSVSFEPSYDEPTQLADTIMKAKEPWYSILEAKPDLEDTIAFSSSLGNTTFSYEFMDVWRTPNSLDLADESWWTDRLPSSCPQLDVMSEQFVQEQILSQHQEFVRISPIALIDFNVNFKKQTLGELRTDMVESPPPRAKVMPNMDFTIIASSFLNANSDFCFGGLSYSPGYGPEWFIGDKQLIPDFNFNKYNLAGDENIYTHWQHPYTYYTPGNTVVETYINLNPNMGRGLWLPLSHYLSAPNGTSTSFIRKAHHTAGTNTQRVTKNNVYDSGGLTWVRHPEHASELYTKYTPQGCLHLRAGANILTTDVIEINGVRYRNVYVKDYGNDGEMPTLLKANYIYDFSVYLMGSLGGIVFGAGSGISLRNVTGWAGNEEMENDLIGSINSSQVTNLTRVARSIFGNTSSSYRGVDISGYYGTLNWTMSIRDIDWELNLMQWDRRNESIFLDTYRDTEQWNDALHWQYNMILGNDAIKPEGATLTSLGSLNQDVDFTPYWDHISEKYAGESFVMFAKPSTFNIASLEVSGDEDDEEQIPEPTYRHVRTTISMGGFTGEYPSNGQEYSLFDIDPWSDDFESSRIKNTAAVCYITTIYGCRYNQTSGSDIGGPGGSRVYPTAEITGMTVGVLPSQIFIVKQGLYGWGGTENWVDYFELVGDNYPYDVPERAIVPTMCQIASVWAHKQNEGELIASGYGSDTLGGSGNYFNLYINPPGMRTMRGWFDVPVINDDIKIDITK
jgi:hypothetical protein